MVCLGKYYGGAIRRKLARRHLIIQIGVVVTHTHFHLRSP